MDLVRIEHDVEEVPVFVIDPVTGKKKRTSKMDLITMKRKRLPNLRLLFKYTIPFPVSYPTRGLIFYKLRVPTKLWTIEDEEYYNDSFRRDSTWIVQPTDEEVRERRDWETTILLGVLRRLKEIPEEPEQ